MIRKKSLGENIISKPTKPAIRQNATLGEGALWCVDRKVLYWVDILRGLVYVYDWKTG
jgi:sugar lactone lactonase YvrE